MGLAFLLAYVLRVSALRRLREGKRRTMFGVRVVVVGGGMRAGLKSMFIIECCFVALSKEKGEGLVGRFPYSTSVVYLCRGAMASSLVGVTKSHALRFC